jgi:hypothetical protein
MSEVYPARAPFPGRGGKTSIPCPPFFLSFQRKFS